MTQGKYALVDNENYSFLNQWKWYAHLEHGNWYAIRNYGLRPFRKRIRMQQVVLDTNNLVDHIDGNGLNNQSRNLRLATNAQNLYNKDINKNNSTGYKGVHFNKIANKFQAGITIDGKKVYLGLFENVIDAAKKYDEKAVEFFGEFAKTNFDKKGVCRWEKRKSLNH